MNCGKTIMVFSSTTNRDAMNAMKDVLIAVRIRKIVPPVIPIIQTITLISLSWKMILARLEEVA